MANLTFKLEEDKTEAKAILVIESSNDISKNIIEMTKEIFADELKFSGSIIPGENKTKIQMILKDRIKIDLTKDWMAKRAMKILK